MAQPYDYTVDGLLVAVRDYVGISPNSEDGTDARILRLLNREQSLYLQTLLQRAKGQHRQSTLPYTVVPTTLRYSIPTRAIAAGIKMVEGVDASGKSWMLYNFPDEDNARYGPFFSAQSGQFYIEGNDIVFYSAPPAGTLKVTYSRRMSALVQLASAGIITAINTGSGVVAISPTPSGFGTVAAPYDFVRAAPHFDIQAMDKSATRSGANMTFASADLPSGLVVGDYVCLAGQTPVSQAPAELHPVLAQRVAFKWLEAKGDQRAQVAFDSLKQMAGDAMSLIEPRLEEEGPLVNRYAPGWARWPFVRGSTGQS